MTKNKNIQESYIILDNIKCKIIRERIKNTYIHIKNSNVIVTTSKYTSDETLKNLLFEKKSWIEKKLEKQNSLKSNIKYQNGDIIYVLGKPYILNIIYINSKRNYISLDGKKLNCNLNIIVKDFDEEERVNIIKKLIEKYYRFIAIQEVPAAMEDLQERTGLHPKECNIKKLKATWGICSSKKYISINLNLMAYSRKAIEYVCLHELCHLKHMNHSKEFWNLVEYYMPDYKLAKKELKE